MAKPLSDIKGFFLLVFIIVVVGLVDISLVFLYKHQVKNFLGKQKKINHADAGIVFFGDYLEDGRSLGPDSKNRGSVAVELYKTSVIERIICVGGYDTRQWRGKSHLMSLYLQQNGIPIQNITYDSLSFNTITNWNEAKKIIEREKYDTVIAISAPLHVYRISKMIGQPNVYYASYSYEMDGFDDYWQLFRDVHHEWFSHFLSFALSDDARNRIVYFVRSIFIEIKAFL